MSQPKISVIIPVYNTEKYLDETLLSVLNQTFIDEIEVLMIDDGSTDNSRYIIEKYALDYENFHAFHKSNEGQGIARNFGLNLAKGEYVHFLDADDYIIPEAYEKLYNAAKLKDYDFVVGNCLRFNRYNCWESKVFKHSFEGLMYNCEFKSFSDYPTLLWDASSVNKLYKKEFLDKNNIKFPSKKILFEDIQFSFECYVKSSSFYFLNEYFYFWRLRDNSTSVTQHNDTIDNFYNRINILQKIKSLIEEYNLDSYDLCKLYERWLTHDLGMHINYFNSYPSKFYDDLINQILDLIDIIPHEFIQNLNSYYKIIYKMVENRDIESLLYFTSLENELKNNSDIELNLKKEYTGLLNLENDALSEKLNVKTTNIDYDDSNIFISFDYNVDYLSNNDSHNMEAIVIDENGDEFSAKIVEKEILIPFDLIKNKKQITIKLIYSNEFFSWESFLINNEGRNSIIHDDLIFEMAIGVNTKSFINIRSFKSKETIVDNISFDNNMFIFEGNSECKINEIIMENVLTFKKISYPVFYDKNHDFIFKIPYTDMMNAVIKKWELKSDDLIKLSQKFEFFKDYDKLRFINLRNIILIEDELYNKFNKLNKLSNKNLKLKKKNSKLINKNNKLKEKNNELMKVIENYKSRRLIKLTNKFK